METRNVKELERTSSIVHVAIELGIKVRGSVGMCFKKELHGEDEGKPTLYFNTATNRFNCKICPDVGGSVVDLVCQFRGWEREEAIDWLAHRAEFDRYTSSLYHGKGKKR